MNIERKEAVISGVKEDLEQVFKEVKKGIAMYLIKVFLPNLFSIIQKALEDSLRKRL